MSIAIKWVQPPNTLQDILEDKSFENLKNHNVLQSDFYGRALCAHKKYSRRIGVLDIEGTKAAIFQIFEHKALGGFLQAVMLDRGPLWVEGYDAQEHFPLFLNALDAEFPSRIGRVMRFMPEIDDAEFLEPLVKAHGYKKVGAGYETFMMDLTQSEEDLRANLKKNWRGSLQKAEKSALEIEWDEDGKHLEWLMKFYGFDKRTKGYDGPDVEFMRVLSHEALKDRAIWIGRGLLNGKAVAAVMIFLDGQEYGRNSTYQIGWNSQGGREVCAHHLLLMDAMKRLKARGFKRFDLGGINDENAIAVKKFKEGLGGRLYRLPGLYTRKFF